MFYRVLHRNSLLPIVLLPFLLVLFFGRLLFDGSTNSLNSELAMPLFELVELLVQGHPVVASIISLALAFFLMFSVNRMNTRFMLLKRQSVLPGLVYLIFISGYVSVQELHPVWFFSLLFAIALIFLFDTATKNESSGAIFNASFFVSTGVLFFGKGVYVIPLFWMMMVVLNLMKFRYFMASLLGLVLPFFLTFGVYYLMGQEQQLIVTLSENFFSHSPFFQHNWLSKTYNGFLVLLNLTGIVMMAGMLNNLKIITRKYHRVFIWMVVYLIFLAATPFFSMEIIPLLGIGSAYVLTNLFDSVKNHLWQEVWFGSFFLLTLICNFFF